MRRVCSSLSLLIAVALMGCGNAVVGDPASDAGRDAAAASDAQADDAGAAADSDTPEGGQATDAAFDAPPTDALAADAAEPDAADPCGEYIDLSRPIVLCGDDPTYAIEWVRIDGTTEECPPYVTLKGNRYATLEAAIAGESCDDSCVYQMRNSFSAIYCLSDCSTTRRYGWITYEAEGCDTLYELPGGLYKSVSEWIEEQTNVCSEGPTSCLDE